MARIDFTPNLQRHLDLPACNIDGNSLHDILNQLFQKHSQLRGYLLDDQGQLRKHMKIFIDGRAIQDNREFSVPVRVDTEIFIVQALSGG